MCSHLNAGHLTMATMLNSALLTLLVCIYGIFIASCNEDRSTTKGKRQEPRGLIPIVILENMKKMKGHDVDALVISKISFFGLDDLSMTQILAAIRDRFSQENIIAKEGKIYFIEEGVPTNGEKNFFSIQIGLDVHSGSCKYFAGNKYNEIQIKMLVSANDSLEGNDSRKSNFIGYWQSNQRESKTLASPDDR